MTTQLIGVAKVVLVAALAAALAGCGDDDADGAGVEDGGWDGGFAGRSMSGRGGNAGIPGGDAGPSVGACVDKTTTTTAGAVESECVSCLCESGPIPTVACNETCWSLVTCFAGACAEVDVSDMNATAGCAFMHCEGFIAQITPAIALMKIIDASCRDECIDKMTTPEDAGMDAGE